MILVAALLKEAKNESANKTKQIIKLKQDLLTTSGYHKKKKKKKHKRRRKPWSKYQENIEVKSLATDFDDLKRLTT